MRNAAIISKTLATTLKKKLLMTGLYYLLLKQPLISFLKNKSRIMHFWLKMMGNVFYCCLNMHHIIDIVNKSLNINERFENKKNKKLKKLKNMHAL